MSDLTARLLEALTRGDHDQHDALYGEVYRALKAGGRIVPPAASPDEVDRLRAEVRERRAAEERVRALLSDWRIDPTAYGDGDTYAAALHDAANNVAEALGGDQ